MNESTLAIQQLVSMLRTSTGVQTATALACVLLGQPARV